MHVYVHVCVRVRACVCVCACACVCAPSDARTCTLVSHLLLSEGHEGPKMVDILGNFFQLCVARFARGRMFIRTYLGFRAIKSYGWSYGWIRHTSYVICHMDSSYIKHHMDGILSEEQHLTGIVKSQLLKQAAK